MVKPTRSRQSKTQPAAGTQRLVFFDSVRGFAMVLMAVFHFCFDLNQFGVLHQNMGVDDFWLNFRAVIMTLFLGVAGVSMFISQAKYSSNGFRQRLVKIAACAVIISAGSYLMNPQSWIFFGVLHLAFVASLLGPALARHPLVSGFFGLTLIILPLVYRHFFFNQPILIFSGLSPVRPFTEDFAPFAPWLGVFSLGIFLGFLTKKWKTKLLQQEIPILSQLGHWSLPFYMTHQFILYPLAWLISQIVS